MTRDPMTIAVGETLAVALETMASGQFRRLPVVEDGRLVGILSDRDLCRHEGRLTTTMAGTAMTDKPLTVTPEATVESAAALMIREKISGLPVVEGARLVGILTTTDVMRAFLELRGADVPESVRDERTSWTSS